MIPNFEILNFSFRNGIFCINLKDCIGNFHSIPFETGYLKNDINNYRFKSMHGFSEDYIGHIHVFITDFLGLYHILEKRIIHFTSSIEPRKQIVFDVSFDLDIPDLIVKQCTNSLYVVIYYPVNKVYNIEAKKELTDSYYSEYLGSFKLEDIFKNNIVNAHEFYNFLANEGVGVIEEDYDSRTKEEREYDSLDDEEAKRYGFPDLWFDEQLSIADRNEYLKEKQEEMDDIERNQDELFAKFNQIKLLDVKEPSYPDYLPSVTFLLPSLHTENKCAQIVSIKLEQKFFNNVEYYGGANGNVIVNTIRKYPLIFDGPGSIINLDNFRKEMSVELQYSFDFEYKMIYVDIIEMVEPPVKFLDETSDDYESHF